MPISPIDSYEKFCDALSGGPLERKRAGLILFVRDWMIRLMEDFDEESGCGLDKLFAVNEKRPEYETKKDVLSRLVDESILAVKRISENMRLKILRENVKMPVHKVREINSRGLNWLSRRPGDTVREKVASSNGSILAVRRRMSLDTGENRLYVSYLDEMAKLMQKKLDAYPPKLHPQEEADFCLQAAKILQNPDLSEIRRWENMPPNNTLLTERDYKKIWSCWNELKQVDELVRKDDERLAQRICALFYVQFIIKAKGAVRFPQAPVGMIYEDCSVSVYSNLFYGVDAAGNRLEIIADKNTLHTNYLGKRMEIRFCDDGINISMSVILNGKKTEEILLDEENILDFVERAAEISGLDTGKRIEEREFPLSFSYSNSNPKAQKCRFIAMDLFSLRPSYIADEGALSKLKGRLLCQRHTCFLEGAQKSFYLPCDQSKAIVLGKGVETANMASALEEASSQKLAKLFLILRQYVAAGSFLFVFPDLYQDFQLSLVYKAARLSFQEVGALPESVGAAFSYMATEEFAASFRKNEFLLVLDLTKDAVSMTLIQGLYDENIKNDIPEYSGILWERHPAIAVQAPDKMAALKEKLFGEKKSLADAVYRAFGLRGLESESRLVALFDKEDFFTFPEKFSEGFSERFSSKEGWDKSFQINITDEINGFLRSHKEIIKRNKVRIFSFSKCLLYKGGRSFCYVKAEESVKGARIYEGLQKKSQLALWRNHLPKLSLKLLYGSLPLMEDETVTPRFLVPKKIRVPKEIVLSKQKKEHRFYFVQGDLEKARYTAIVRNPAFPLRQDVRCRLEVTYQYGSERPYQLSFIPVQENAGFFRAKAALEKLSQYPYQELAAPGEVFSYPWDELKAVSSERGLVDLTEELASVFESMQKGYFVRDLSKKEISVLGEMGKREFILEEELDGKPCSIKFKEENVEINAHGQMWDFAHPGKVSFELDEDAVQKRYCADLKAVSEWDVWMETDFGHVCFPYLNLDGKRVKVAFFENEFDEPQSFHTSITKVSFGIEPYKSYYKAVKIRDERHVRFYGEHYLALHIRNGDAPMQLTYDRWMRFMMLNVFAGKNSFYDRKCPKRLRDAFENAKDEWLKAYERCDSPFIKLQILKLLSIAADDLGGEYYRIAGDYALACLDEKKEATEYLGYALGSCKSEEQKSLLKHIYQLKEENTVRILSRAVWGHGDFLWNAGADKLFFYFDAAVRFIKKLLDQENVNAREVAACFEYILGIFRFRGLENREIKRKLSLNNPIVQELYELTERSVDRKIPVESALKLKIRDKGEYDQIPDLLYAVLGCITGECGAGDIKMTGVNVVGDFEEESVRKYLNTL